MLIDWSRFVSILRIQKKKRIRHWGTEIQDQRSPQYERIPLYWGRLP